MPETSRKPRDAQHQEPSAGFSSHLPEEVGSFMPLGWQRAGTHRSPKGSNQSLKEDSFSRAET